jgi:hypothetical protein
MMGVGKIVNGCSLLFCSFGEVCHLLCWPFDAPQFKWGPLAFFI